MSEKKSSFFGFFPSPASTNATPASQTEQKETSPQSASDSSSGSGSLSKFDYSILQPITVSNIITSVPKFDEHKLLGIDDGVEYLMIEENPMAALQLRKKEEGSFGPLPMRNNTDKMFYGCGAGYLAGLTSGGLYGFARGMSQSKSKLYRLRVNSVLNSVTRYGPRAGNSMGILTIFWAGLDTAISKLRDDKSDYFNHLSAAFLSGLIFKSTAGIKPALTAGVLMASAVGSYGVYEWVSDWLAKSRTQEPVWLDKVKTTASRFIASDMWMVCSSMAEMSWIVLRVPACTSGRGSAVAWISTWSKLCKFNGATGFRHGVSWAEPMQLQLRRMRSKRLEEYNPLVVTT